VVNILRYILSPFTLIFWIIVKVRNCLFDNGIFNITKVDAKVLSIGNITVGGSGKTPTVLYVSSFLKSHGLKVGVLSRGYRRDSKGYKLVSDGNEIKVPVNICGDEIYMAADELNIPAAVSERRVEGAEKFLKDINLDTIVLDDAFQHRWIHRDLDIVLIDQRFVIKSNCEKAMLPLGHLREPFSSLKRADVIIINRKFSEKIELPYWINKYIDDAKLFFASYEAVGLYDLKTHNFFDITEFQGQKSLVVCGIAKPYSFFNVLEKNKIDFTNKLIFTDHQAYAEKEVQLIRKKFYDTNAFSVVTTHKDAVKLTNYSKELDDIDIYYLKIALKIENKEKFESILINKMNNNKTN